MTSATPKPARPSRVVPVLARSPAVQRRLRRRCTMRFRDRRDAGQQLADRLAECDLCSPAVLGLPRGGVPVAAEIGARLGAPVEVFVARKVAAPGREELGIGAVAEGWDGLVITDDARERGLDEARMGELSDRARREVQRGVELYRRGRELPELIGRY